MKFKSLPFIAAAAMMSLASCSSDEPAQPAGNETGTSYLNVSINLPTVASNGGRSLNDVFDDGEASEYAVKKAHLVIFQGATEADAEVKNVYEMTTLKPWNLEGTTTDNVTTSAQTVQKINEAPADNLWALIVLNDANATNDFAKGTKFSDLTGKASTTNLNSDGFFMTNAPLFENNAAKTLVKIVKDNIKPTAEAAQTAPAVNIYVERALAKVQLIDKNAGESNQIKDIPSIEGDKDAVSKTYVSNIEKWALDLTNESSFLIRNVSDFSTWKGLASKIEGAQTGTRFYSLSSNRIYWAIDPNYDTDAGGDASLYSLYGDKDKESKFANAAGASVYCRENTFDVAHQNQNQTTRVVIKATFKPVGVEKATTFYTIGASNTIYNLDGIRKFVKAKCIELFKDKNDPAKYEIDGSATVSKDRGPHTLAGSEIKYDGDALSTEEIATLNNAIGTINTYLNGECFYVARIQHFGETYTPWVPGSAAYGTEDVDNNYLGRYGVVRNNWYTLEVSEIKTLGSPIVPEPKPTPDDENNYYISVKCNIHSWAKRVQNIKL